MNNTLSSTYMPKNNEHNEMLVAYDKDKDIWLTNLTWRVLANHAFTAVSALASVRAAMFFWKSLHFSGFGMIGAGFALFTLVTEIYKNQSLLAFNDEIYSVFGYDHLANDVKHINSVLTYFSSSKNSTHVEGYNAESHKNEVKKVDKVMSENFSIKVASDNKSHKLEDDVNQTFMDQEADNESLKENVVMGEPDSNDEVIE